MCNKSGILQFFVSIDRTLGSLSLQMSIVSWYKNQLGIYNLKMYLLF